MATNIRTILETDCIGDSRVTINNNFSDLQSEIDRLTNFQASVQLQIAENQIKLNSLNTAIVQTPKVRAWSQFRVDDFYNNAEFRIIDYVSSSYNITYSDYGYFPGKTKSIVVYLNTPAPTLNYVVAGYAWCSHVSITNKTYNSFTLTLPDLTRGVPATSNTPKGAFVVCW